MDRSWVLLLGGLLLLAWGLGAPRLGPLPPPVAVAMGALGLTGTLALVGLMRVTARRALRSRRDPASARVSEQAWMSAALDILHTRERAAVLGAFSDAEVQRLETLRRRVRAEGRVMHTVAGTTVGHDRAWPAALLRCDLPGCYRVVPRARATAERRLLIDGRWFCSRDHADRFAAGDGPP